MFLFRSFCTITFFAFYSLVSSYRSPHFLPVFEIGTGAADTHAVFIDNSSLGQQFSHSPAQYQSLHHSFTVAHSRVVDDPPLIERKRHTIQSRRLTKRSGWTGSSSLVQAGVSGVGGMQVSVVDEDHVLIFDRAENNPLKLNGLPVWSALYTISTQAVRALYLETNSFCAGGGWLSNGTLVSVGGNVNELPGETPNAQSGLTSVRMFTPGADASNSQVYENPSRIHLASSRWYASTTRLTDGSLLIWGGMLGSGYNNQPSTDNPTLEFFPPKFTGLPIYSNFLHEALNTNLFPITYQLPSGEIFVAANKICMLYNWQTNTEKRLPSLTGGERFTYPASPASALLPLTIANSYIPTILICGGTTLNTDGDPGLLSAQSPASKNCYTITLTPAGIKKGWLHQDTMSTGRVMGDAVITPDGKILIVNGAQSGIAGYSNVQNEVGESNSANPDFTPTLYDPLAPAGQRFSNNFPTSQIERLYHSSASLLPDGRVMITGSNPNWDVFPESTPYGTRYEVEMLSPPYIFKTRPSFSGLRKNIFWGKKFALHVKLPSKSKVVTVVIMDIGYSTHGVHMNSRLVELAATLSGTTLTVTGPHSRAIFSPGYAWLFILCDGVPSKGKRVMVGSGASPPVSQSAINNLLANTQSAA